MCLCQTDIIHTCLHLSYGGVLTSTVQGVLGVPTGTVPDRRHTHTHTHTHTQNTHTIYTHTYNLPTAPEMAHAPPKQE